MVQFVVAPHAAAPLVAVMDAAIMTPAAARPPITEAIAHHRRVPSNCTMIFLLHRLIRRRAVPLKINSLRGNRRPGRNQVGLSLFSLSSPEGMDAGAYRAPACWPGSGE